MVGKIIVNISSNKHTENTGLGIPSGHIALGFSNHLTLEKHLRIFCSSGLQNNFLNVLIVSEDERKYYQNILRKGNFDVNGLIESGNLLFCTHEQLFDNNSIGLSFTPVREFMSSIRDLIHDEHKSGVQIVGTIANRLAQDGNVEHCSNIESSWNKFFEYYEIPYNLFCPYKLPLGSDMIDLIKQHHANKIIEPPDAT